MERWGGALLQALHDSACIEQAFDAVADAAQQLGFDLCAYGYQFPLPFTRKRCYLISNYDPCWRERYKEAGYLRIDPTVLHARRSLEPVLWNDATFGPAAQLWDEARSFGLRHGWAQACFGPEGGVGLLTLARDVEPLTMSELRAKEMPMRFLVNVAHGALSSWVLRFPPGLQLERLTPREREVLRWAADGKTSNDTARLLSSSPHTIEFHMKNATRKMGAGSRPAATARAAATGLLR
ncbi:LuxR family transcriptional regulator [Pseudacidovorax sp. RU35E]|uniref:LuxR family transcriptional regulator n=1 Tax=Pseudacidovorax sp. RU35E TaxID=1907403 RepID=UPI000955D56F|nr:LuxR family transcriptional regulator [Pseudacidovorax sp. RU35E]SIR52418.1 LuxR family transcriptional regulator [Pseudacidovorax sp. RU35E]